LLGYGSWRTPTENALRRKTGRPAIDKVIITSLLIVAGVVATVLAIHSTFPAIVRSSNSVVRMADRMDDRIESQISVVYATSELDKNGVWQDTNANGKFDIPVWVKNVGASRILGVDQVDVFFGRACSGACTGSFQRIPYFADAGGTYPQWNYTIENDTEWKSTATLKITILYSAALGSDTYLVKVVTPAGAYADQYFSF
jgi:hypothetical protein